MNAVFIDYADAGDTVLVRIRALAPPNDLEPGWRKATLAFRGPNALGMVVANVPLQEYGGTLCMAFERAHWQLP